MASFSRRQGFTLSEMLVVLGVLVVVTALAQPAMRTALGDSRLRAAAHQICAELAKARVKAMQSGTPQRFRYQVGKNRFEVAPAKSKENEDRLSAKPPLARRGAMQERQSQPPSVEIPKENPNSHALPDGVSFGELPDEPALGERAMTEGWSEPVVFYPNGHTADARIRIKGERNAVIDVSLRGLTGVATAGKARHEEELR